MESSRELFHVLLKKLDRTTSRNGCNCWKIPTPQDISWLLAYLG